MGTTKALVEVDGVPMARRVAEALHGGGCEPVLLVGGSPEELAPLHLPVVADAHPGEGPLGGVLTALRLAAAPGTSIPGTAVPDDAHPAGVRAEAVFVAPCDLPSLDSSAVRSLIEHATTAPDVDVVVARGERLEPALAIWRTTTLDAVETAFDRGERALHRVVGEVRSAEVVVDRRALHNVNAPGDIGPSLGGR